MASVLIADDSMWMRKLISKVLDDMGYKSIYEVRNGLDAVSKASQLHPDLILMDLIMPKMDGFTALTQIMEKNPTKVILMSSYNQKYANTAFQGLEHGAIDFIQKPNQNNSKSSNFIEELRYKVRLSSLAKIKRNQAIRKNTFPTASFQKNNSLNTKSSVFRSNPSNSLIVIGASTGGPVVIRNMLNVLKSPMAPIIIIQHLPANFTASFTERLDRVTDLKVVHAVNGLELLPNTVYVAHGGKHLVIKDNEGVLETLLHQGDHVNGVRPSLDPTLISASYHYENRLITAILTGMGFDGLAGVRYSKQKGALILSQDQKSSLIYGMPKAINDEKLTDFAGPPNQISAYLNLIFNGREN